MKTTNALDFKSNLSSVSLEDIQNLRDVKADKTLTVHMNRIKAGKFTKSEIGALTKLIAGQRFAKNEDRKLGITSLINLTTEYLGIEYVHSDFQCEIFHFRKPSKITKEQSDFGKAWLKSHFFKLNGDVRRGKSTGNVSERVLCISKTVSRFEFIGFARITDRFGNVQQALPIYRAFCKSGNYFDYAPIHWGQPVIMEGY